MGERKRARIALVGLGLTLALVAAACGGEDEGAQATGATGATAGATGATGGTGTAGPTLVIGGWGGAIDEATDKYYLQPFQAETGIGAVFEDAPGTQLASVEAQVEAGNITWDALDSVAGDAAFTLWDKGLLEPLPADVKSQLEQALGPGKVTDFGFSHANVGHVIVCNMDVMDACPANATEFFDTEKFPEPRMLGGIAPLMQLTLAQVAGGTPTTDTATTPVDLDAALELLNQIKPFVRVFYESGDQQLQVMRSGEVDMAVMWSGRAYALKAEGMNLQINWAGGVYEPSYWAVVKGAPHLQEAFDLLLSIANNVEGQAGWATDLHYSVPNPDAMGLVPADIVPELADVPENFSQIAIPNFEWYAQNVDEANQAFEDYLRG